MNARHLAQINIGRMLAPLESPVMADFVNALAEINALAERRLAAGEKRYAFL